MQIFPKEIEDKHMDVFMALADGLVHDVDAEVVAPYLDKDFPKENVEEYVRQVTKPSQIPRFKDFLKNSLNKNTSTAKTQFCIAMSALDLKILGPALTGSTKLVLDMTDEERMQTLLGWRNSPIEFKNKLFRMITVLTYTTFQRVAPDIHFQAMGYPKNDLRDTLYADYVKDEYIYKMMDAPLSDNVELYLPNFDAVIIGSGSGAGVVAHTLARAGHKCLVIEKGKYFTQSELVFDEETGYAALYEGGGLISTTNALAMVLAGATFGGGSTVNWSACLKTPFKVRKEWYDDHGLEWAATEAYDNDMDYVLKQMGVSTENIVHSFSNQRILEGSAKLGYSAKVVPQNSGKHTNHSCGYCHLGCKWGVKQGSLANWLRDAADHGAEFMDQVRVDKILNNKRGHAVGLACTNLRNGNTFTIKGPRKFVVSSGSLQTPVLLQRSGFRNKHIGKNLRLHPITAVSGVWDEKTNPQVNSIMTSVCTEVDDMDGKAHGAKIETLLHTPLLEGAFFPYSSSKQARQDLLKYQGTSSFIILTRDTLSGSVTYEKDRPDVLQVEYLINKTDREHMLAAVLVSADIMYVEGAQEIIHPYWKVDRFVSKKPKHERSINDADFQAWRKKAALIPLPTYGPGYGSAHQMSTCRISGKGPSDGACDLNGRLYESDNVYVADGSVMPTASGANPMVSIMAMSRHIALGIAKDLLPAAKF